MTTGATMSSDSEQLTDQERRSRSKDCYEAVIRVVDYQSGHMQPPLAKQSSVLGTMHASHGIYSLEEIHSAIVAGLANGDLIRVEDAEGVTRLGIADETKLREKIESNLSRMEDPRKDVIGLTNRCVQQLRGDSDE